MLGKNISLGEAEGETEWWGLLSQACSLGPRYWRVMRYFRVFWVQRKVGVHHVKANLGLL